MDPFTYVPPTPITQPRYDAIRLAEIHAKGLCTTMVEQADAVAGQAPFIEVRAATLALHDLIGAACPRSADTAAAQRCVRIARMAANEAVVTARAGDDSGADDCLRQCLDSLRAARWQACAAIALCPESDLPPWQPTP